MNELHYGKNGDVVKVYHHTVLGLAFIKHCHLLKEDDYATKQNMTAMWFNSIVDWLCDNYPGEFKIGESNKWIKR